MLCCRSTCKHKTFVYLSTTGTAGLLLQNDFSPGCRQKLCVCVCVCVRVRVRVCVCVCITIFWSTLPVWSIWAENKWIWLQGKFERKFSFLFLSRANITIHCNWPEFKLSTAAVHHDRTKCKLPQLLLKCAAVKVWYSEESFGIQDLIFGHAGVINPSKSRPSCRHKKLSV